MPEEQSRTDHQAAIEAAAKNQQDQIFRNLDEANQQENERLKHVELVGKQIATILEFARENDYPGIQPYQVITGWARKRFWEAKSPVTTKGAGWQLSKAFVGTDFGDAYSYQVLLSSGRIGTGQTQGSHEEPLLTTQHYSSILAPQGHTNNTEHRLDAGLTSVARTIGAPVIIN